MIAAALLMSGTISLNVVGQLQELVLSEKDSGG